MSSEVWKVAQNTDAQTMYETSSYVQKVCRSYRSELEGLNKITSMCKEMSESFNEVIQDQNNYVLEFETLESDFIQEQNDIKKQIKTLLAEIKTLEAKEQDGTITEDEQKELDSKKERLNGLYQESSQKTKEKKAELKNNKAEIKEKYSQKEKIASDYGNLAVDKGNDFIDDEIAEKEQNDEYLCLFRFVLTGRYNKHLAGKDAVAAGSDLLDKVSESSLVDKKISSKKLK